MFRHHIAFTLAFVTGILMSSFSLAAAPSTHQGKVTGVGASDLMLLDTKDGEMETFSVNSDTKIVLDGKPAKLVDIQVGFTAEVAADMTADGKFIAKTITATSKLSPKQSTPNSP